MIFIVFGFQSERVGPSRLSAVTAGVSEKAMAAAVILWFLMATTGPRMDDGGPIAHPHSLAHFHTKAECEKKALEIVKENTLPGQVTTYSCVKSSDQDSDVPE